MVNIAQESKQHQNLLTKGKLLSTTFFYFGYNRIIHLHIGICIKKHQNKNNCVKITASK